MHDHDISEFSYAASSLTTYASGIRYNMLFFKPILLNVTKLVEYQHQLKPSINILLQTMRSLFRLFYG